MWGEFWLAALVGFIFLYVPTYVMLRVLKFSPIASAACAPLTSLLAYSLLAIVLAKAGVWTSGWLLFGLFCAIVALVVIVCLVRGRVHSQGEVGHSVTAVRFGREWRISAGLILLYLVVGIVVTSYVFLGSLSTPDCTSYTYDDYSHLSYVRSFIERGNFSSLAANYEYDLGGVDGYYPAAWHLLAASVVTMANVPLYVGTNVAEFLCCATIFPLSCLFLVRKIFANDLGKQIIGAFLTLAFAAFPWEFVYYGRLVSNMLAFCFAPLMLGCTMLIFGPAEKRATRIRFVLVLLASFMLSVFTQPSVCFTWIFFSVPYLMHRIWNAKGRDGKGYSTKRKVLHVGLFCVAVFAFLIFCYMLPFLYSVTRFKWRAPMSPSIALGITLTQGFPSEGFDPAPPAPFLAVLVFTGVFFAIRRPETRWIVLLWVILLLMYVLSAGTNLRLKNYVTGWWYTDSHRVLAMYAIISYYLAVLGLGALVQKALCKVSSERVSLIVQACVGVVAAVVVFWPNIALGDTVVQTPFGCVKYRITIVYHDDLPDETFYSGIEEDFVAKAAEITGDARVFNIPKDGSLFAYASSGMNTLLRYDLALFSTDASTRIVQRGLDDYATDRSVQNAVDDLGFEYVLILDKGHEPGMAAWYGLSYQYWKGPTSLDENTPGFELVLKEGDMELYRVLSKEEMAQQAERAVS